MLTASLQASTFGYLSLLDQRLLGVVSGLYVVGSAALGDFSERVSNVDLVAVSDDPWSDQALAVAVAAQDTLKAARPPVVAYVTAGDLAQDPSTLDRPCFSGPDRVASDRLVNPLTWKILDSGAVDLRGPDRPRLWAGPGGLQIWAAEQLRRQWAPQLPRFDRLGAMWFRRRVSGAVLDVSRLAVAAMAGDALSKTEAARVLEPQVPGRFRRTLADAVGYRSGGKTSMYWGPLERKQNAMELLHQLVTIRPGGAAPSS